MQSLHLTYLSNLLQKASRGKYTKEDAIRLRELAKISVGTDSPALALQIRQAVSQIELFSAQLEQVESEISSIMNSLASPIMTIPGIGHLNGAMILSCIGNIQRFSSPDKLLLMLVLILLSSNPETLMLKAPECPNVEIPCSAMC